MDVVTDEHRMLQDSLDGILRRIALQRAVVVGVSIKIQFANVIGSGVGRLVDGLRVEPRTCSGMEVSLDLAAAQLESFDEEGDGVRSLRKPVEHKVKIAFLGNDSDALEEFGCRVLTCADGSPLL